MRHKITFAPKQQQPLKSCRKYLAESLKSAIFAEKINMSYTDRFKQSEDYRRDELIRIIERSVQKLTIQELESLYYDMSTKNYIND